MINRLIIYGTIALGVVIAFYKDKIIPESFRKYKTFELIHQYSLYIGVALAAVGIYLYLKDDPVGTVTDESKSTSSTPNTETETEIVPSYSMTMSETTMD